MMWFRWIAAVGLSLSIVSVFVADAHGSAGKNWQDPFYPYRVQIDLEKPVSGKQIGIDLAPEAVVEALKPVCIDVLREDTLAMEKALLIDRQSGRQAGGYRLVADGESLDIDGQFDTWKTAADSSKWGTRPSCVSVESVEVDGQTFQAIRTAGAKLDYQRVNQRVHVQPGQLYMLEYWINTRTTDGTVSIMLYDPSKNIFNVPVSSYANKIPPFGKWTRQRVLYAPDVSELDIGIVIGVPGEGFIGDVHLTPVRWQLVADLQEPTDQLDLYMVMTAGHSLTQPWEAPANAAKELAIAAHLKGERADLNPDGLLIDAGEGIAVWTLPSYLPLRVETLGMTKPTGDAKDAIKVSLLRGEAATVLVAVETGMPLARVHSATCDLPIRQEFNRLAAIPVFDSFTPQGKYFESRLDAMVPLDFALMPPSANGIHVIAMTLRAPRDAKTGAVDGIIAFTIETQEPVTKRIEIPVHLDVIDASIKPTRHFGTISGTAQFSADYSSPAGGFTKQSVTVGEFHGIRGENMRDDYIAGLSLPDRDQPQKEPLRELGRKYSHRTLDFDIVPSHLTYLWNYTYTITDQGPGKRPLLSDWKFTQYDKAIDELVIGRDAPWVVVWHTGGDLMRFISLSNGKTYSIDPPTDKNPFIQLSRDEYLKLLGDYFDAVAAHLQEKGVLDRAVVVIDESTVETFEMIHDVVGELKSRPFAKQLIIAHTTQTISTYTRRTPDGRLYMDDLLDMPMPQQDEHYNYFEPEWASRFKRPGNKSWVYYVQTDRLNIHNAGLSTVLTPLQLRDMGVKGWYLWAMAIWSMPYKNFNIKGIEYDNGPLINPWVNPYYHHGYGMLSFFYPPDPRGPADEPTDLIIPSYRLALIRDGLNDHAVLDVAEKGEDDDGKKISIDQAKLKEAQGELKKLWPGNPVQWYLSYETYRQAHNALNESFAKKN